MLKGVPPQSPGLIGLTNCYLLIYYKRCSRQGTREPARGWTLLQSKNTVCLWTGRSLGTTFAFATTFLCLVSLVTVPVEKCLMSTGPCFVMQEGRWYYDDTIRDLLTSHMSKVCRNVETEPLLQPLDNEIFNLQSTVTSREARLDMKAGGFWTPGVTAFFDVRVTHVNSRSNQGKHTATIFKEQENEKKRKYHHYY